MNQRAESESWRNLYRVGGTAPLIALAFYLSQFLLLFAGDIYPTTPQGWFELFQRNKLLGLFVLNALDIISIALLGTMFLALYVALRGINPSYMTIAIFFAFLGIAVFVSTRAQMVSATLSLSDQYAAATTEAQRARILAAGQAVQAPIRATHETIGFLFTVVAGLIVSMVMLRSDTFGKVTAYVGIVAGIFTFANDASIVIAPSLATILMPINGLLWLIWWLLISRGLFRLARSARIDGE